MDGKLSEILENQLGINDITAISEYILLHGNEIGDLLQDLQNCSTNYLKNAGWALMHVAKKDVSAIFPYRKTCYKAVLQYQDERILRNLLFVANALFGISTDEEKRAHFELYDRCIVIVTSELYAPGTRSNALSILEQFCKIEPELSQEITIIINAIMDYASAGLKSKAQKVLKSINQHQNETR